MTSKNTNPKKSFLPHLYDPLRRKIAMYYVQQEFRKLLPQLRNQSLWQSIDQQIEGWYETLSMRNFWNGVHGISMGFRLKSLIPWITSLNIEWSEQKISVEELWFGGKFGSIKQLNVSEHGKAVKEALLKSENEKILKETQKITEEKSTETAPRNDFPIFVVHKKEKLVVIDGNRRLMDAISHGKETVRAVIGKTVAEPPLFEHWVPTSLLVDLVFWHKRQTQIGRDTTETTARMIAELVRDSSAGRIEFRERSIHKGDEIHERLLEAVNQILAEYGVALDS